MTLRRGPGAMLRFAVVGAVAAATHWGVAVVASRAAGLGPWLANSAGFAAAVLFSYAGHYWWTFGASRRHREALPRFVLVALTGFASNQALLWLALRFTPLPFEVALLLVLLAVACGTWVLSRRFAYASPGAAGAGR